MKKKKTVLPDEALVNKIYFVRGQKVMIDRDLAELYNVETRTLKQAVRRNMERFPKDFMFEMTIEEMENWRSQIVISNFDHKMGLRHRPFCFTEQGVTMLSCILNSRHAIAVNIRVIRIFTRLREALLTNKDILLKLEQLEKQVVKNSEDVRKIFAVLRQLLEKPVPPRRRIGYKTSHDA
jgi:hypothetical protein